MITVNGQDISIKWGIEPTLGGFYSAVMKDAGIKDRIVGDYPDTDGVIVSVEDSFTKSQEITLSFLCDSYAHYYDFLTYCVNQKVINMYESEINEILKLEYLSCSSFNTYGDYNLFVVKFREADPTNR